jgi:hypothetical protein
LIVRNHFGRPAKQGGFFIVRERDELPMGLSIHYGDFRIRRTE